MQTFDFEVTGYRYEAQYDERDIKDVFLPLLRRWTKLQHQKGGRLVVFLAGPPAVGKSTLAVLLETLSKSDPALMPLTAIGMDGYHFPQAYLLSHTLIKDGKQVPMVEVKGSLETFDLAKLREKLRILATGEAVRWPLYDRRLHDVVEDAIEVMGDIVLIEGNYLLSDEGDWQQLRALCDDSVFVGAQQALLAERLISRKQRGGVSREQAEAFYRNSDGVNVIRVLTQRQRADTEIEMDGAGRYRLV